VPSRDARHQVLDAAVAVDDEGTSAPPLQGH